VGDGGCESSLAFTLGAIAIVVGVAWVVFLRRESVTPWRLGGRSTHGTRGP